MAVQDSATQVTCLRGLCPAPDSNKPKTHVGRGEDSRSRTSGRGTKGTKARYQAPTRFEGSQVPLHIRLPKLYGSRNPFHVEYQVVDLDRPGRVFPEGNTLTVTDLTARSLAHKGKLARVLDSGEVGAKFDLAIDTQSQSAKTKVETKSESPTARQRI